MPSGPALETGVIYCDDNLTRMATLPSDGLDLVTVASSPIDTSRHRSSSRFAD
jgi:hypothetical protein